MVNAAAGGDVVPLSRRIAAMAVVRGVLGALVLVIAAGSTLDVDLGTLVQLVLAWSGVSGGISALLLLAGRRTAVLGFGLALTIDGLAVQYVYHLLGPGLGADTVIVVLLVAICLLGSFRTGLRATLWQSVTMVALDRGLAAGLLQPTPGAAAGAHGTLRTLLLIWTAVLVTAFASATNERELRRRRYDAEALQAFAARLHEDETTDAVLQRALSFAVEELNARRALVCTRTAHGLSASHPHPADLLAGTRTGPQQQPSALLDQTRTIPTPALALTLVPDSDPWLGRLLPGARRIVALRLGDDDRSRTAEPDPTVRFLVFEHGERRGSRIERRVVATAGQVAAITSLAASRARLLERTRRAATTDALTGVANRGTFESWLRECTARRLTPTLILVDIDHFKAINDRLGHQAGDETLRQVAATLRQTAGSRGAVARYGGEEFVVLVTSPTGMAAGATASSAGAELAELLRRELEALRGLTPVTASFGVATGPVDGVVAAADAALYRAKESGRNRVEVALGADFGA